jgi:hypothetical protein
LVDALIRPPGPGAGDDVPSGSLVDVDAFRNALVEGALRVGMTQLASQVLGLPGNTGLVLLDAVRGRAAPGELLGELTRTVLGGGVAGGFPGAAGLPGGGGPGGMPGLAGGGGGGAVPAGNPVQAGIGALARYGGRVMAGKAMRATDEVLTPRVMSDIDFYSSMGALETRASLDGKDEINGREAWVLRIDDVSGVDGMDTLRAARMLLWIDSELYVPLRAEVAGETEVNGQWRPVEVTAIREDYREAGGMLFPGRAVTVISGPENEGMLSGSQRNELRDKIATGMQQLQKLPEQYRDMAEQMIGSRVSQLEAMMGPGPMEFDSTLIEVRVNEGPPPELAEQAKTFFEKPRATGLEPGAQMPGSSGTVLPWLKE